jgi:hypothetical protein
MSAKTSAKEFYTNHRAETFLKRMRALISAGHDRSGLSVSTSFKYLRFAVFGDDNKPHGSLEIRKDAILNLGRSLESGSGDACWQ